MKLLLGLLFLAVAAAGCADPTVAIVADDDVCWTAVFDYFDSPQLDYYTRDDCGSQTFCRRRS